MKPRPSAIVSSISILSRTSGFNHDGETCDFGATDCGSSDVARAQAFRSGKCRTGSGRARDCRSYIHGFAISDAQSFESDRERRAAIFHCSDVVRSQPAIEGAGSGTDGRVRRDHAAADKRDKIHCWQRTRRSHGEDRDGAICVLSMNWVRAHYEKVLLIGAALLLFLSSIFIWLNAARFSSTMSGIPPAHLITSVCTL